MTKNQDWWRSAVLYQIYPRSFLDTNGDGTGDLPGITARLGHIAALGAEGIWICPFYPSPMKDFGYDVSDYRGVDPVFGTLADFDALLEKAHKLGLKVIIDLVLSHTSDRHPWFHDPAKKDWYVWADGKNGGPPNNWVSVFGGPAWTFDETRGQYYFHNFLKEQPDLNFHNPAVQAEMLDTARFWLERGVDGFRLDTVNFYFQDRQLRDNPPRPAELGKATQLEKDVPYSQQAHIHDKSQPENLAFLKSLRALTNEYGAFMVGELGDDRPYERAAEYTAGDELLHTTYNMDMMTGRHRALTAALIREPIDKFLAQPGGGWPSWAFSNHDVVRAASRWCADGAGFGHNPALSKMLIALLGCLPGTLFLYQGEELGLPEARLTFEDLRDPWAKETWPEWQGRDGCRTPMPWTDGPNAGFSKAAPWLPVCAEHLPLNAAAQEHDLNSTLNFTKDFLHWRKSQPALLYGDIEFADAAGPILKFTRRLKGEIVECAFDFAANSFSISGYEGSSSSSS